MKISAFTIVRNEADLIAKHLVHLASIADEVVCVVQPSKDATALFVKDILVRLRCPIRIVWHEPKEYGWEFSLEKAIEACSHDWMFGLCADESYVGKPLSQLAAEAKREGKAVVAIPRWHAVARDKDGLFKVEKYRPEVRLLRKDVFPSHFKFSLHIGLNRALGSQAMTVLPEVAQILEYKSPERHYTGQCWLHDRETLNEKEKCDVQFSRAIRKMGYLKYKAYFRE